MREILKRQEMPNAGVKKIFLGGGGGELDSVELDTRFVSELDRSKPLIYIPVAAKEEKYQASQQWFVSTFSALGVYLIETRIDLNQELHADGIAGIYIGGGNTLTLMNKLRDSAFDVALRKLIEQGVPVYGGSAGAIVLGKDTRTSPEGKNQTADTALAMNLLHGHAVYCHFGSSDDVQAAQKELGLPIIALSERTGAYLQDETLEAVGFESVWIFNSDSSVELKPGEKYSLKLGRRF